MTREEKIAEARRMRASGALLREIADRLGCGKTTALRWTSEYQADRDRLAARAWKRRNHEGVIAYGRAGGGKHRYTCPKCGHVGPLGSAHADGTPIYDGSSCRGCKDIRREEIVRRWAEGWTTKAIAESLGITLGFMKVEMVRMREEGYDLPYRHVYAQPKHPELVA
jgi:transposase